MSEIRIKMRKRRDKLFYVRAALAWVLMVGALLVIYVFTMGGPYTFKHVMIFSFFCVPLSILYSLAVERMGSFFGTYLSGWNSRQVSRRETVLADLGKAKHSKMKGAYEEALNILNGIIQKIPDSPDALLLMAQVQWEGYQNFSEAKKCLQRVMLLVPRDETLHNWASSYYDEIVRCEKKRYLASDR
jgi:tetratricopeptide (TPR) repeat protein